MSYTHLVGVESPYAAKLLIHALFTEQDPHCSVLSQITEPCSKCLPELSKPNVSEIRIRKHGDQNKEIRMSLDFNPSCCSCSYAAPTLFDKTQVNTVILIFTLVLLFIGPSPYPCINLELGMDIDSKRN